MMIIGATTTWNNCDIVAQFLRHSRKLGLDQLLVMDFASDDGTQDLIRSGDWAGFVRQVSHPGIAELDSSNLFLDLIRREYPPGTICLFCDPDEFLVTPNMDIREAVRAGLPGGRGGCLIPRFNVTASREDAVKLQEELHPFGALRFRIVNRVRRNGLVDMHRASLTPPWIWSAIPGKVLVNAQDAIRIADGDHSANLRGGEILRPADSVYLLHYPFRKWREFQDKISVARIDMARSAHYAANSGWQIRRWIRLADEGRLYEEYLEQFVEETALAPALQQGRLVRDDQVRWFHHDLA
jgi:hypothetical protein